MPDQVKVRITTEYDGAGAKQAAADVEKLKQQETTGGGIVAPGNNIPPPIPQKFIDEAAPPLDLSPLKLVIGGLAAEAGFVINAVRTANQEQAQLNAELEKEIQIVDKLASKWRDQAEAATSAADIARIIDRAIPALDQLHGKVQALHKTQLSFFQAALQGGAQYLNLLTRLGTGLPGILDSKTYEKSLDQTKKFFDETEQRLTEAAADAIRTGKEFEESFARMKDRPVQAIQELSRSVSQLKTLQDGLNLSTREGIELWRQYQQQIDNNTKLIKELGNIQKQNEQQEKQKQKAAADFAKDAEEAKKNDPTAGLTEVQRLQQRLKQLSDIGERPDLTPAEQTAAHDAYIKTQNDLRDAQIQADKDSRNQQAELTRRRYEGPGPDSGILRTLDYFEKGPGSRGASSAVGDKLDTILNYLKSVWGY